MTVKIKYDKHGNVKKVTGNVGRTRMTRGALKLWKGEIEPTTGYKLRRFFRRLFAEISEKAENAACDYIVGTRSACDLPYIGIEDRYNA